MMRHKPQVGLVPASFFDRRINYVLSFVLFLFVVVSGESRFSLDSSRREEFYVSGSVKVLKS
jgi:hypothetical protein